MAVPLIAPPGVSDLKNFRALESWHQAVQAMLKLTGSRTIDVGSIAAGATGSFTVTVTGARADVGQTVQVGLPSTVDTGLVPWGTITADDVVTVYLYNRTGSPIDPASATYYVRVMP
jgi:hypothetical protein